MVRFWLVKYKVLYSLTKCFCAYDWHKDTTIFLILYVFSLIFLQESAWPGTIVLRGMAFRRAFP